MLLLTGLVAETSGSANAKVINYIIDHFFWSPKKKKSPCSNKKETIIT